MIYCVGVKEPVFTKDAMHNERDVSTPPPNLSFDCLTITQLKSSSVNMVLLLPQEVCR